MKGPVQKGSAVVKIPMVGNMQVGLLLSLTEDPPQSLFSGRSLAAQTHPRPFAPTAHQKWITTALQFLKEMDVISARRAERRIRASKAETEEETKHPTPPRTPTPRRKAVGKVQRNSSKPPPRRRSHCSVRFTARLA